MIAARRFGLIDSGWPIRRQGRSARPARASKTKVERRFRRDALVSLTKAAAPPAHINLAVTNLTLSPRFAMIWQDWRESITRLEQLEREISRETSPDVLEVHRETALVRVREIRQESSESLLERGARVFVKRIFGGSTASRFKVLRGDSPPFVSRPQEPLTSPVAMRRRRTTRVEIQESGFSLRSKVFSTERAQTPFASQELWILRLPQLTVTRQRMQVLYSETGERAQAGSPFWSERGVVRGVARPERPFAAEIYAPLRSAHGLMVAPEAARSESPREAQAYAPLRSAQSPLVASRATERATPPTQRILRAAKWDAPRVKGRENSPAERVFRAAKPAAPPESPAPVPATPAPVLQAPAIDIGKLDTLLWQRFERRLRIERERRGRA